VIVPLALIGLALSAYALLVVKRHARNGYKPLCDITANISCSKAFLSEQGRMLGIHNAWYGIAFYASIIILHSSSYPTAVLTLVTLGALRSVQLAYVSYVVQKNFCVVCTLTYLVNLALVCTIIF